ncbi:hypothetical protein EV191_11311 [Tamaricihabitans halophyticus]|uniref:DUF8017 domain-containing protein n=1 Tax=Tamaricihabitans halophyticus TaxID=1262583 RepID=A0A4R2QIG1_9PSEU|nr:hypothetical protein [Tamaricihabitans halophyticus]TCP46735.1 hypothetical protein EV191_11311 [Tamaricihabitans halophyticus]
MSTPGGGDPRRESPEGEPYQRPAPYFGGYQGSSDYQGLGVFSTAGGSGSSGTGGPGGSPKGRTKFLVTVAVLAVLAIGGVTALIVLNTGSDEQNATARQGQRNARQAAPTTTSQPASSEPADTTDSGPTGSTTDAVTPGWQGVLSPDDSVAYDVPSNWSVESPGMRTGLEDDNGKPLVIMHGVAFADPPACADGGGPYAGATGFMTAGEAEPRGASRAAAKLWADAVTESDNDAPQASTTKVADGQISAHTTSMEVRPGDPSVCDAKTIKITTVAFDNSGQTAVFLLFNPQGKADSTKQADVDKIVASLRPAE